MKEDVVIISIYSSFFWVKRQLGLATLSFMSYVFFDQLGRKPVQGSSSTGTFRVLVQEGVSSFVDCSFMYILLPFALNPSFFGFYLEKNIKNYHKSFFLINFMTNNYFGINK
jgi:hypothetical protein